LFISLLCFLLSPNLPSLHLSLVLDAVGEHLEPVQVGSAGGCLAAAAGDGSARQVSAPVSRLVESATTSTSGRSVASAAAVGDALVSEMCMQSAKIDAVVRMECERMCVGLEQCQALVRSVSVAAARRLREKEVELEAARRRAAELEEQLRQATAESQAWCGLAHRTRPSRRASEPPSTTSSSAPSPPPNPRLSATLMYCPS
uniref:SMARCC C-terminal domain-containing protein n=1 Tax=Oryza glaberrima TaxID=4538 RepID=I1QZB6_ORYGL